MITAKQVHSFYAAMDYLHRQYHLPSYEIAHRIQYDLHLQIQYHQSMLKLDIDETTADELYAFLSPPLLEQYERMPLESEALMKAVERYKIGVRWYDDQLIVHTSIAAHTYSVSYPIQLALSDFVKAEDRRERERKQSA